MNVLLGSAYLFGTGFFGVMVSLMDQKVARQDPVVDTGQVDFVEAGGLIGAVANEAFVAPGGAFLFKDDVGFVRVVVVLDLVGFCGVVPASVVCGSMSAFPGAVEHVDLVCVDDGA